jgi:hypothetical protein
VNWSWRIGPHDFDTIAGLPCETQAPFADLLDALEADPFGQSQPFGIDDGVTRIARFGAMGILVVLVNSKAHRLTPINTSWAG